MSLVGSVIRYAPKVWNYGTRLVKASPYIIFGDAAHSGVRAASTVTRSAGQSWTSVVKNMFKEGGRGIEANIRAVKAAEGSIFTQGLKALKSIPRTISVYTRKGIVEAGVKGTSKLAGGLKGFFKGVGKKMPLIGNLMLVAFELPNIFKATKEQGIIQGGKEVVKAGTRLTAASIASAIGTAVAGPIGGIVGFIAGDWLASKVVGKSYTEKKAEEEQKAAEDMARLQELAQQQGVTLPQQPGQVPFTGNSNPFQPMYPYGYDAPSLNPYADDFMMQGMNFNMMV